MRKTAVARLFVRSLTGVQVAGRQLSTSARHSQAEAAAAAGQREAVRPKTALLMLNMGGPRNLDEVHDFLLQLFKDRDIIQLPFQSLMGPWIAKRRTPSIKQKYDEIGGGSPIFKWTDLQGKLMCERLDTLCPETAPHKHYVGFRYARPLTEDTLQQIEEEGAENCVAFSQYPQYSCSTSGSSMNAIHKFYADRPTETKLKWSVIDRWGTNSFLVKCFAENIKKELEKFPAHQRKDVFILFSAHSLPLRQVERGDPYSGEVGGTVQLVMQELGFSNPYRLVWQSKVGPLPWLSPATDDAIKGLVQRGRKNMILVPIAFTSDHIETLHELDIEYAQDVGKEVGAERILRCAAPNDHPLFIDALVDVASKHLGGSQRCSEQFLHNCPLCVNKSCFASKKWFRHATQTF